MIQIRLDSNFVTISKIVCLFWAITSILSIGTLFAMFTKTTKIKPYFLILTNIGTLIILFFMTIVFYIVFCALLYRFLFFPAISIQEDFFFMYRWEAALVLVMRQFQCAFQITCCLRGWLCKPEVDNIMLSLILQLIAAICGTYYYSYIYRKVSLYQISYCPDEICQHDEKHNDWHERKLLVDDDLINKRSFRWMF
eukprot:GHVL01024084.1.p1 GENE.GHVL01024084.1~~GHVL01024084.1.p1  ORF type:complete len:196 (+),score=21.60 GHVL01024084.1:192-779(+)